jgi:hypothetical protein
VALGVSIAVLVIVIVIVIAKSVNTRRHHAENLQRLIEAGVAAADQARTGTTPASPGPTPAPMALDADGDPKEND